MGADISNWGRKGVQITLQNEQLYSLRHFRQHKHKFKASKIYLGLRGYRHFTVEHKHTFVQRYRNEATGQIKVGHTNTIEGSWKFSKDHFRRMNGSKVTTFEAHICELIWRNQVVVSRKDVIQAFFDLIRFYYSLRKKAGLEIRVPLFDSWNATADDRVSKDEMGSECSRPAASTTSTATPRTSTAPPPSASPLESDVAGNWDKTSINCLPFPYTAKDDESRTGTLDISAVVCWLFRKPVNLLQKTVGYRLTFIQSSDLYFLSIHAILLELDH